ncbi:30S ribosomal protein S17 [Candidatus Woesearchaeota archaeon]|nr:30S ribosomal protein S17 [Candidatus Woesearchaeota archaeon]
MTAKETKKEEKTEKSKASAQCADPHCPFHGMLSTRGRTFIGKVISDRMSKSVTVRWDRSIYVPKYERFEKKWSKAKAHNPDCLNVKMGDTVKIVECRPISKTKHFVVVEKIK